MIYVDEAGTTVTEPVTVVAAIFVDADRQWERLRERLSELCNAEVPAQFRDKFCFHALEVYGDGKKKYRTAWALPDRVRFYEEMLKLPKELRLTVVFGWVRRADGEGWKPKYEAEARHMATFFQCIGSANAQLKRAFPNELGVVIAENSHDMRKSLKKMFSAMADGRSLVNAPDGIKELVPVRNIIDTVHFADKADAPLLQLADACAFAIRRFLAGLPDGKRLFNAMCGIVDDVDGSDLFSGVMGHWAMSWNG